MKKPGRPGASGKVGSLTLKGKNLPGVLAVLQRKSRVSRAEIARRTRLTPATVSNVVSALNRLGITRSLGQGESRGGRRPILIEFNPKAFYLAGVDLGITKVIAVVTDLHGRIVSRVRAPIDIRAGRERIVEATIETARAAVDAAAEALGRIAGIGLSVPGLIDAQKGISILAPNIPEWRDVPIVELFEKHFRLPALIENDSRAMALGEARFGAGRGYEDIFCVNVGHGVGAGIIIGGELRRGKRYTAGEFGHLTVLPSGPLCHCGNRGCLEVVSGGLAIAANAIRVVSSGGGARIREMAEGNTNRITAELVVLAAKQGDPTARRLLEEAGWYLGIAVANIVNLLEPEIVVIGGGVAGAGETLFEEIREIVRERAFTTLIASPRIVPCGLGENASAIGAAALVLDETIVKRGLLPVAGRI